MTCERAKSTEPMPELILLEIDVPLIRDFIAFEMQQGRDFDYAQAVTYTMKTLGCNEKRAGVIVETVGIKPTKATA